MTKNLYIGNESTRMKRTSLTTITAFIVFCSFLFQEQPAKNDLRKVQWIEGNWKGLYNGKPFYEHYKLTNDSTLTITSYEWNGKDSSNSSMSMVRWVKGSYYLGDSLNWKTVVITDSSIVMIPNYKAANEILWKKGDKTYWTAFLATKRGQTVYKMERVHHFE
jgi:hypothetical protein